MVPDFLIPEPIAFNCFKHHRNFILEVLKKESYEEVKKRVTTMNNNYIDIYTGSLLPSTISSEIHQYLRNNHIDQNPEFEKRIAKRGGFAIAQLSDQSLWILRLGNDTVQFVHVHPSKTGLFCQRVKGSTLKFCYLLVKQNNGLLPNPPIEELNFIRQEAGLSPIKRWEPGQGFQKALKLFA